MRVYFRPLPTLTNTQLSRIWLEGFHNEFPQAEERNFLVTPEATFDRELIAPSRRFDLHWSQGEREPIRLWLKNPQTPEHILQFQRSAFLANWLKRDDSEYIDFGDRRAGFHDKFAIFLNQVSKTGADAVAPKSCTVRYINHVPLNSLQSLPGAAECTLCGWKSETSDGWLPQADVIRLNLGYPFPDQTGRLDIVIAPAAKLQEETFHLQIDLTATVNYPKETSIDEIWERLDRAHEWIVRGFVSITTPEMHQQWGRIQ